MPTAPRNEPVLPMTNPPQAPRKPDSRGRPVSGPAPVASSAAGGKDALEPIGPERLRALREAIENGTYPTEEDVLGGLDRLLESPNAPHGDDE